MFYPKKCLVRTLLFVVLTSSAFGFAPPNVFPQLTEYETLSKDVCRSAYTMRILEIVGNIKKQKEEITKVFV